MSKRSPFEPLLFAGLILVGIAFGVFIPKWMNNTPLGEQTKMEQIMSLVESQYVDSISEAEVEESAIQKFLTSFDPHSVYIPYQYVEMANQELKGGFDGIGVEFFMLNDTPYVVRVLPNGPAAKSGLRPGDRILKADSTWLIGLDNNEVIQSLKGQKNTEVKVDVRRLNQSKAIQFSLKRATIAQESVQSAMVDANTAYFKIIHFAEPTHQEFQDQFNKLNVDGKVENVIVDLRNNPGGYLKTAIDLLDEFVDSKEILSFTKGQDKHKKTYYAAPGGICAKVNLICLVNGGSASASEIFSGAIQDLDRGILIGERTFGKGLVQETFQLTDGSQVRLTIARYYIPSGRSIQKPYDQDGYVHQDSSTMDKEGVFKTKNGRIVKSEGGVLPDINLASLQPSKRNEPISKKAAQALDELYAAGLVTDKADPKAFLDSKAANAIIEFITNDNATEINLVQQRLRYQLWSAQSVLEYDIQSDKWVLEAIKTFPIQQKLLNP